MAFGCCSIRYAALARPCRPCATPGIGRELAVIEPKKARAVVSLRWFDVSGYSAAGSHCNITTTYGFIPRMHAGLVSLFSKRIHLDLSSLFYCLHPSLIPPTVECLLCHAEKFHFDQLFVLLLYPILYRALTYFRLSPLLPPTMLQRTFIDAPARPSVPSCFPSHLPPL